MRVPLRAKQASRAARESARLGRTRGLFQTIGNNGEREHGAGKLTLWHR